MTLAVIGLGSIGRRHLKNFHDLGVTLTAWDHSPEARERVRGELPFVKVTETVTEAAEAIEGLVICTPPSSHLAYARLGISRYAGLMIEKPLEMDAAGAKMLVEAADEARVPVLTAYPWRYWPPLQYVKRLLHEKRIGRVLMARTEYAYHLSIRPTTYMTDPAQGGGCLLDESHAIDFNRWLLGEIVEVSAVIETRVLDMATDDLADLTVRFRSGAVGFVHMNLFSPQMRGSIEIVGSRAELRWDRTYGTVVLREGGTATVQAFETEINRMYIDEATHFLAVLRGEATPICDGFDGYQTMRVIDAARRSSAEKRWITV